MDYVLIGSKTSPFVRRIRMLMENIPHELKELNIYEPEGAINLNKVNPVNQIPVLLAGETKIWDSRQIFNYLNLIHKLHNMDWEDENTLTAIDGAMSSAISLFMLKRSGADINEDLLFINRQKDRIESVLDYLKPYVTDQGLKEWNFITMSIYAFLDWGLFREMINLDQRPEYQQFLKAHAERPAVKATEIPRI